MRCRHGLMVPTLSGMEVEYTWRGVVDSVDLERLHGICFDHPPVEHDWAVQLADHSLGWVTAVHDDALVGFVNVAWDGAGHAFILDTIVAPEHRHMGIGTRLIETAVEHARAAGCEWLHVDYDDHLRDFYETACGFTPAPAGLIQL